MLESIVAFFKGSAEIKGKRIPYKVIIAIAFVVVMVLAIILFVNNRQSRNGLYKNFAWGTSWENVLGTLEQDKTVSDLVENDSKLSIIHHIRHPEGNEDIVITSILSFDESRSLNEVGLLIEKEDDSLYSDDELIHELCYRFNDLYGDYAKDGLDLVWRTSESEISFLYISDGFFLLNYVDIHSVE